MKLTAHSVENKKPGATRVELTDSLLPGLRLVVQPTGVKSWAVRYSLNGRKVKHTLGSYPVLSLADARERGRDVLKLVAKGEDPRQHDTDTPDVFEKSVETYLKIEVPKRRPSTRRYVHRELGRAVEEWRGRPLKSIVRRDVIAAVDKACARGDYAANTFLKCVAAFFHWCESRDLIQQSPARGVKKPGKSVERDRVLDDNELRAVWKAADKTGGPSGALVKLLILTGARRDEIASLQWSEIVGGEIRLPKERTKTSVAHTIYITKAMRQVIDKLSKSNRRFALTGADYPVSFGGRTKDAIKVDIQAWRFHDLRRSFTSGCARIGIDPFIIERMLNQKIKGIAGIYQRHTFGPQMKAAWEKWSAHILSLVA
jgi:integrase